MNRMVFMVLVFLNLIQEIPCSLLQGFFSTPLLARIVIQSLLKDGERRKPLLLSGKHPRGDRLG